MKNDQLALTGERKSVSVELKLDDEGHFEAIFSTFNVIDHDGDVTLPGAFEEGAEVIVGAYGHNTWSGALPVGKGVIKQTDKDARIVGEFWLNTKSGKEHYTVAKELGVKQEWSYGYDIKGTGDVEELPEELQRADRVLTKLEVFEVSPVLRGAGIDTQTVVVKDKLLQPMKGERLAALLNRLIDDRVTEDRSRADIISAMGSAGGISAGTVNQILNASIQCPPQPRLAGFARSLGASLSGLISAAESDGCDMGETSGICLDCAKNGPAIAELARFERIKFERLRR